MTRRVRYDKGGQQGARLGAASLALGVLAAGAVSQAQSPPAAKAPLTDITPLQAILQAAPAVTITNGPIRAKVFLPDPKTGFYRGVRFDWAGVLGGLTYKGHDFYVPWFAGRSPSVRDFTFQDGAPIAAPNTAANGPVEEFVGDDGALGYADAKPGGRFIKIGVGVLQRLDDGPFAFAKAFPLIDGGTRTTEVKADSVAFTQTIADPGSGYGYHYVKRIRLLAGQPTMVIEHELKNTGSRPISTSVYDHNFLNIDGHGTPQGLRVGFPATATIDPLPRAELASAQAGSIVYKTLLTSDQRVTAGFKGFGGAVADYDFHVTDPARGLGVHITADIPVDRAQLWSIAPVMAIEPFVKFTVQPGQTFRWSYRYDYQADGVS